MARNSLKNVLRLIEEMEDNKPIEESFLADLERSIELQDKKTSRPPSQTYKPSSMNCIRNMYYQVIGAPQDDGENPYTIVGICNSGSDIHQRIQQAVLDMKSNGMDCEYVNVADFVRNRNLEHLEIVQEPDFEKGEYETKLYDKELNISFLCDGIICYKDKYYILELKTESTTKFIERKGVDPKHYNQGITYSMEFGIPNVIFIYINRDVLNMKSFMFTPTDDQKNEIKARIEFCNECVEQNRTPEKPENAGPRLCNYCNYRTLCRQEE